jgi:hypothetical protein
MPTHIVLHLFLGSQEYPNLYRLLRNFQALGHKLLMLDVTRAYLTLVFAMFNCNDMMGGLLIYTD